MLRPRKKLIKKEIKEDTLVTAYFKVQKIFSKYSKQIQIGVIAVAVVAVLGFMMVRDKKKSEIKAVSELGLEEPFYYMGDYQRVIPKLTSIKDKFSGTPSAGTAVFFLANAYYATGNVDQAVKNYQIYVDDYGQNPLFAASSLAGLGACYETKKQYDKAAELYEKAGTKYKQLFSAPYYLKDAGRCYILANNKIKAKSVLQDLIKKYPNSNQLQEAELLAETL